MADRVLYQTDDELNETNLTETAARGFEDAWVERNLGLTADHVNETLDVETGYAVVADGTQYYDVFPDKRTGLSFATTTGVNHVYLWIDTDDDDTLGYYLNDTAAAPSASDVSADGPIASLKVGEVDAGADTTTELNREPSVTRRSLTVTGDTTLQGQLDVTALASTTATATGGSDPADEGTIQNVSTTQTEQVDVLASVDSDPSFDADYEFSLDWWLGWDDSPGELDVNYQLTWQTDPGNSNDVTVLIEVYQR